MARRLLTIGILALVVAGCGTSPEGGREPLTQTVIAPPTETPAELTNPLRGQYEALLLPLFPQGNPAQRAYPPWPRSDDASERITWRQLQPVDPRTLPPDAPDTSKYDFRVIDDALAELHARGMRLMLRVQSYNSCCNDDYPDNTNVAVPDWVRRSPGAVSTFTSPTGVTQVVPDWNNKEYLAGFEQLLAALGRRYDGDERLSVFEFSGYGDFSENHIAYLRDTLGAPGPEPQDSMRKLGYFSQFRDQSIRMDSISRLVAANVAAFPRTRLVTTPQNPEIVRQLLSDTTTAKLSAPVGIRSDCLGVDEPMPAWADDAGSEYVKHGDPLVDAITRRWMTAPVITEWCQLPEGEDRRAYYEKGLRDVVAYHVSMTSSVNFADREASATMPGDLFAVWSRANVYAGYRYSAEVVPGSETVADGTAALDATWTNSGAAAAVENWTPTYDVLDGSGVVVRSVPAAVNLKTLVAEASPDSPDRPPLVSVVDQVRVPTTGLPPGRYFVTARVAWDQHKPGASFVVNYPPMQLGRDGRDAAGRYPVASFTLP